MPSPFDSHKDARSAPRRENQDGQPESEKSAVSLNLGVIRSWTEKKIRGTGQPQKRRGPKPDSKPALTRRQELNRQAQRTHRERKELYIKALEQEVLRLKEGFSNVSQDKDTMAEENRQLKAVLAQYSIPWVAPGGMGDYTRSASTGNTSSERYSESHAPGSQTYYSPPQTSPSTSNFQGTAPKVSSFGSRSMKPRQYLPKPDYDQAGIDFVLMLERPCMDHMHNLVNSASQPGGRPCGHALMASCPPYPGQHLDRPYGRQLPCLNEVEQRTWEIPKPDLANLLNLSKRLDLDGEITPVMAWGMIQADPRFIEMELEDFEGISMELSGKIKCYGFGAVLEEFQVRDALENVFFAKQDTMMRL